MPSNDPEYARRYYLRHREEVKGRARVAYLRDRDAVIRRSAAAKKANPERQRRYRLRTEYGITPEIVDRMLEDQGGGCGICRIALTGATGHVDHDHKTGRVRGILCGLCNRALGAFLDSRELLFAASNYLANAESEPAPATLWNGAGGKEG